MNKVTQSIYKKKVNNLEEGGGGASLADIVDSNGNKRFVEGSLTEPFVTGLTYTYNKWSLSGTHLMIVLAGSLVKSGTINANTTLASVVLPDYINDKIVPLNRDGVIAKKSETLYSYVSGNATMDIQFIKNTQGAIFIAITNSVTNPSTNWSADFRVQLDLLIDSE